MSAAHPPITSVDVVELRFPTTRMRTGYTQDEVDALLDRVSQALILHEHGPIARERGIASFQAILDDPTRTGMHATAREAIADLQANGDAPDILAAELVGIGFTTTRWQPGYDPASVDAALARIHATLVAHESR